MNTLHIIVADKIATYQKRDGEIVCGNSDYQIKFTLDSEWDAYGTKTARFIWGGQFQDVEFTGDTCQVPILSGVTSCTVGVYAGELCTTTPASIPCKPSILCPAAIPSVENDKYYANEAKRYAEEAKEYAEQASTGGGGTGTPGADGATFTPSVSEDGVLSWTNDKGLDNPDPVDITGPQGPQGEKGETGAQGPQGEKGANGYTPKKGIDYYTEDDIADINANSEAFIASELAKRGQLKPEFANSVEECTDTTKLYVLPDGYIYAYMSTVGALFTNQIANAIDTDGTPYNNGLGYKRDRCIGASGAEADGVGSIVTGYIPIENIQTLVLRVSGYTGDLSSSADQMKFYNASFANINIDNIDRPQVALEKGCTFVGEPAFNNAVKTFTFDFQSFKAATNWYSSQLVNNNATYVRFSLTNPDLEKMVVTINEQIAFGTTFKWTNTGHAFVPADYEERIIDLEETAENHEGRIKALETYGTGSISGEEIPAYIKAEAEDVIDRLIEVKEEAGRCFTIVGLSDFHYYNYDSVHNSPDNDNRRTLINASKAISYINNRMHIDAVATLGDIVPFGTTDEGAIRYTRKYFKEINEILTMTQQSGVIDFRAVGNHDRAGGNDANGNPTPYIPDNTIYSYIGGYNRQCDYVSVPAGYGYKDFESYKLRVIVLNTAECEGKSRFSIHSGYYIGNNQYNWLVKTLDLSGKEDADEWQILILSHHRADDWQVQTDNSTDSANAYILPNILNAYKTGGSYSGVITTEGISVSCNFAGKNQAKLIGQIHGHHHNYKYQQIYLGASDNSIQTNIVAIGTPTTSFIENGNVDNEGNTYSSVRDTAEDTAFCVYSIDLDNHKIHAIHYGNGVDREISY